MGAFRKATVPGGSSSVTVAEGMSMTANVLFSCRLTQAVCPWVVIDVLRFEILRDGARDALRVEHPAPRGDCPR